MKPLAILLLIVACFTVPAQQAIPPPQTAPAAQPPATLATVLPESASPPAGAASLATVSAEGASLASSASVASGYAFIGNNGAVTAGDKTVRLKLTRGGSINVCSTTQVHLSADSAVSGGGLMIALSRGALEGRYIPGEFSDVILTPELRILISGPGTADFSIRVNNQGDTCFDNHGDHAPYVLATNLFEGGAYRVQPNQRVLFERGSVQQVVDKEPELCGCPPAEPAPAPTMTARLGAPGTTPHSGNPSQTPARTAAENPFPLAQSEGLKPAPAPSSTPAVPPGQAEAQITSPIVFNGQTSPPAGTATRASEPGAPPGTPAPGPAKPKQHSAFVRFFRRLFGGH